MTFLYERMIEQWMCDMQQYCAKHGIPNMELKNLRQGDVYNYELYSVYKNVLYAIDAYRKTPSSPLYAKELLDCIQKWYVLTSDSKMKKISMRIMPKIVFERMMTRAK